MDKPMIMSTYLGDDENFRKCRELGFSIFQTDSDHLSTNETEEGKWDWKHFDECLERIKKEGAKWMFFPHFAFPPEWYKKNNTFERLRCLEHDETIEAFSIWDAKAADYLDKGYKALAEHYGNGNDSIYYFFLGVHGDYGECMFPAACRINSDWQKKDWEKRFGNIHNHYGYWCADKLAREDFRKNMLKKYDGLESLNKEWEMGFTSADAVIYPSDTVKRRWWLDFIHWYLDSMTAYSRQVARSANRYFPETGKLLPMGAEDEDPRLGQDYSSLVRMAKEESVEVRSTHGGFRPFAANASSQLVHISTACKHYGVPFWSEPPSRITPERLVSRIFEAVCCGSAGYWDWHSNPVNPENREIMEKYRHLLVIDKPVVKAALLFPQTYHYLHPETRFPEQFLELGQKVRDFVHFDILDELLIADGALAEYRFLIHLEGGIFEKGTLSRISEWVRQGGIFCAFLPEKIETVEGDIQIAINELELDFSKSGEVIKNIGEGAVCTCNGRTDPKEEYMNMLKRCLYLDPPGKTGRPLASIDLETDGIYGVILASGKALLYNSNPEARQKNVSGRVYELQPISITEIFK